MLKRLSDKNVAVYAVWVPVLPSDGKFAVGRATKYLPDTRVSHFWDSDGVLVRDFAPVLGLEPDDKAWDVYLLYDKSAEWGDTPPKPSFWQEQIGFSEATRLDGPKLAEAINKTLAQ